MKADLAARLEEAVALARAAYLGAADSDWSRPAGTLAWTCWETVEHVADDLFAYAAQFSPSTPADAYVPFVAEARRAGGPANTIYADPSTGLAGLLQVLDACGALLAAAVRAAPADARYWHTYGRSDGEGFAAMGAVEVLVHTYDIAATLGFPWEPPESLCAWILGRLFWNAPAGSPAWATLLWCAGRADLPGRPALASWRWDGSVRA